MSTDGQWEEEMTTVAFRLRADGYWEAKLVGPPDAKVHTSRSETQAIGFALREQAEFFIAVKASAEDYDRVACVSQCRYCANDATHETSDGLKVCCVHVGAAPK